MIATKYSFTIFNPAWFNKTPTIGEPRWSYDTEVKETSIDLPDLIELFVDSHEVTEVKELAHMFSTNSWKKIDDPTAITKTTKYGRTFVSKTAHNVESVSCLVLDYDSGATIESVQEQLKDVIHVGYTSFSHSPERHKFRVIIPLSRPVPADLMKKPKDSERSILPALVDMFGGIDVTTFDCARSFFMPSCPVERLQDAQSWAHWKGVATFDWTVLPVTTTFKQQFVPNAVGETTDLLQLFRDNGLYVGQLGGNKHAVVCPWSHEHTHGDKSGTVVWEGEGWCCKHSACQNRTFKDLMERFGVPHKTLNKTQRLLFKTKTK